MRSRDRTCALTCINLRRCLTHTRILRQLACRKAGALPCPSNLSRCCMVSVTFC